LVPLALHERFVDGDHLEAIARFAAAGQSRTQIDSLLTLLTATGLLRDMGQAVYEIHPALTGYLRSRELDSVAPESQETWVRGFVDVLGNLADDLASRSIQKGSFFLHRSNLRNALAKARSLGMKEDQAALLQALAVHAENLHDFAEA